jgi:hypothetical protein
MRDGKIYHIDTAFCVPGFDIFSHNSSTNPVCGQVHTLFLIVVIAMSNGMLTKF